VPKTRLWCSMAPGANMWRFMVSPSR
jgi:hypothetical protein